MSPKRLDLPYSVVRRIVKVIQRPGLGGPLPIKAQRKYLELMSGSPPAPANTRTEHLTLGGVPTLKVTVGNQAGRTDQAEQSALVHLHGGAYTVGSPKVYRNLGANLAELTGRAVYLPDYRLAPEHPFPAALYDADAVCREIADMHENYVLSGDSAGGGLAAATTLRLAEEGRALPAKLGLIAPWVDLSVVPPVNKADIVVRPKWGRESAAAYAAGHDRFQPGLSPIFGDLSVLPPTLIQIGSDEILFEQGRRFADKAKAAGADVTFIEMPRLWHVAHLHADLLGEAYDALKEFATFLK